MDFTRKLFAKNLIPAFVREDYPLFIEFIESYYDFLDRSRGQVTNVVVTTNGKNYTASATVSFEILVNGVYVADTKGATATPVIRNGRIEKILVTSFGSGYTDEDAVRVVVSDATGSGATATVKAFTDFGNINELTKEMLYARDVDAEIPLFLDFIRNEFMPTIPQKLYSGETTEVELTKLIKFIKSFYTSVGVEDSVKFLFRILFNVEVDIYYPKTDMLRVSDGRWAYDKLLTVTSTEDLTDYAGEKIVSSTGVTGIIQTVIPDPLGFANVWVLNVTENSAAFTVGSSIALYSFGLININYFGTVTDYTETSGYYIGDYGQPSSRKMLQDSFYYQDFSYEIQSEESITQFKNLLETVVHPAGLKYFIRLNLILMNETGISLSIEKEDSVWAVADTSLESEISTLGPRYYDIERNKYTSVPSFYQDYIILNAVPAANPTKVFIVKTEDADSDSFVGYTALIDDGATGFVRTVVSYNGATAVNNRYITVDSDVATAAASVDIRMIQNFRPAGIMGATGATGPYIQLSAYHVGSTGVTSGLTGLGATGTYTYDVGATGATGFDAMNIYDGHRLFITTGNGSVPKWENMFLWSDTLNDAGVWFTDGLSRTPNAIQLPLKGGVYAEKLISNGATGPQYLYQGVNLTSGTTYTYSIFAKAAEWGFLKVAAPGGAGGVFNLTTGVIAAEDVGIDSSIVNYGSGWYRCSSTFVAASTATLYPIIYIRPTNSFGNILGDSVSGLYAGAAQLNVGSIALPYQSTFATAATTYAPSRIIREHKDNKVYLDSAFTVSPDLNSTYYIYPDLMGATGVHYSGIVESIEIVDGGENYDPTINSIIIDPPLDGITATAFIGATGPTGNITNITMTNNGSGYLTTPSITITGATGFGAIVYPVISDISSYFVESIQEFNLNAGVILSVPDVKNKFSPAKIYCEVTNEAVTSVTIEEPGMGYLSVPTYITYGGEGSGVQFDIELTSGAVSSVIITNLGVNYYTAPLIELEDSYPRVGERVYQASTGASGTIEIYNLDDDLFYIYKDYNSPEFDASDLTYNSIIIEVTSLVGTYATKNKRTNVVSESEINSIYA